MGGPRFGKPAMLIRATSIGPLAPFRRVAPRKTVWPISRLGGRHASSSAWRTARATRSRLEPVGRRLQGLGAGLAAEVGALGLSPVGSSLWSPQVAAERRPRTAALHAGGRLAGTGPTPVGIGRAARRLFRAQQFALPRPVGPRQAGRLQAPVSGRARTQLGQVMSTAAAAHWLAFVATTISVHWRLSVLRLAALA